jgi:hypothetical protein
MYKQWSWRNFRYCRRIALLNIRMATYRDFNILGYKVSTVASKKDIGVVSGYNSIVQKIENVCKTQKGELPSSPYLGSNYYNLIFDPVSNKSFTETDLENYIEDAIKEINNVKTFISYIDDTKIIVDIAFEKSEYLKQQKMKCTIEVPLQ